MRELGYCQNCEFYYDGQAAIDAAKKIINSSDDEQQPISLMLLDFQMPRKNGLQVVQEIQEYIKKVREVEERDIDPPRFVFLTAFSTRQFKIHTKAINVEEVYEKPIGIDSLLAILEKDQQQEESD